LNKILKKSFCFLVIAGLFCSPVLNLFFVPTASAGSKETAGQSYSPNLTPVTVIDKVESPEVVALSSAAPTTACKSPGPLKINLIQDTAEINLNQPADCFSLAPGKIFAQSELKVAALKNLEVKIAVQNPSPELAFSGFNSAAAPFAPVMPLIPMAAVLLFSVVAFKFAPREKIKQKSNQPVSFTLNTFQVLRC